MTQVPPDAREFDVLEERGAQDARVEGAHEAPPARPELAKGIEEIEQGTTSGRFRLLVEKKLSERASAKTDVPRPPVSTAAEKAVVEKYYGRLPPDHLAHETHKQI